MASFEVTLERREQAQEVYGVWAESGDRTAAKDIPRLSEEFYRRAGRSKKKVLPFFVLSRDYCEQTGAFKLFIGGTIPGDGLERLALPAGLYARVTVKPKLGFLWGPAIGEAKRRFYTRWQPASGYRCAGWEYEYHTEKSFGRSPSIDLLFAMQE